MNQCLKKRKKNENDIVIPTGGSWCCVMFSKNEERRKFRFLGHTEYCKSTINENQNDATWSRVTSFTHVHKVNYQKRDLRFAVYYIQTPDNEFSDEENVYMYVGESIVDLNTLLVSKPYYSVKLKLSEQLNNKYKKNDKSTTLLIYARTKENGVPNQPSQLKMEGYLLKESSFRKTWSRRYFLIENGVMKYWKHESEMMLYGKQTRARGVFLIKNALVKLKLLSTGQPNKKVIGPSGMFIICPRGSDRSYQLCAEGANIAIRWLDTMKNNGAILEPTEQL